MKLRLKTKPQEELRRIEYLAEMGRSGAAPLRRSYRFTYLGDWPLDQGS